MSFKLIIFTVILLFSVGVLTVLTLFLVSSKHPHLHHRSFSRIIENETLSTKSILNIQSNAYYFAGSGPGKVYLAHSYIPNHILTTEIGKLDTSHVWIGINDDNVVYRSIQVVVDSSYFFLMDGNMPFIYRGKTGEWEAKTQVPKIAFFTQAVPLSNGSFVMLSMRAYKNVLSKKEANSPSITYFPDLLKEQIDGLFCTAGKLLYDAESKLLVYVYTYRNQYIVLDTAMNLVHEGRTIDPIDTAQIKVAFVGSEKSFKMAAPPLVVNKAVCIYRNQLFVQSNLLSANENRRKFEDSTVIDTYNLENNIYNSSFYIPNYKGHGVRDFRVIDNTLIALQGRYFITYRLSAKEKIRT